MKYDDEIIFYADKGGPGEYGLYLDEDYSQFAGYIFIGKEGGHLRVGYLPIEAINKARERDGYPPYGESEDREKKDSCDFEN